MKRAHFVFLAALGFGVASFSFVSNTSSALAAQQETVRPDVGKPLQAAQDLLKEHKNREALVKVKEADAVLDKTEYEVSVVEQVRLIAAVGAGEVGVAAKAYDALAATGKASADNLLHFAQAITVNFYQAKDYGNAITWANRYFSGGGADASIRTLIVQAYYLNEDYAGAAKVLGEQIKGIERNGEQPAESQLQLLASSFLKQNDSSGYIATLEKLVGYYPKPDYWADLIHRVAARQGFADRLSLDAERLQFATGVLKTGSQYVELAQLALQAGFPGEAKTVIDKGYAAGVLGTGAETDRHKRLQDLANRTIAEDTKNLPTSEKEALAAKDGNALVVTGLDYLGYGQADKAISLIEQGIAKGGLKYPEDAKLHLGLAYLGTKQKSKAADIFNAVKGADGAADLGRLWALYAKSR